MISDTVGNSCRGKFVNEAKRNWNVMKRGFRGYAKKIADWAFAGLR